MLIALMIWLGLCAGSFITALVWRLHERQKPGSKIQPELSIVRGRSMCPSCHHRLGLLDLIPVLSWVWSGGRCRYCKKPISYLYPATELSTALLFVGISHFIGFAIQPLLLESIFWLVATIPLVALALYDLRWQILPNRLVFSLIGWAIAMHSLQAVVGTDLAIAKEALVGAAVLFGSFAAIYYLSRGQWLGGGDVKLVAFIGIGLGWQLGLLSVMLASWSGVLVILTAASQNGFRIDRRQRIAFGPLLILGTYLALFWGERLLSWYRQMLVA
jgi:leader peptidase (prepilin peptidase)/N-methyltransferase